MSGLLRYVLVLALSLCSTGLLSAANSQTKNAKQPQTGSVSGRITLHGKGVAGIIVGVGSSDYSPPRRRQKEVEFKPCQNVTDYQLPVKISPVKN
jgi:hypothetical protein